MSVHPQSPPGQPYFRGISDLTGDIGDLFYGPYGRSTNHYVKNGTAARKRDGYVRAFDELFEGSAAVLYHRDGAVRYQIVADGEGVKILDSLPPSTNTGVTRTHHGFANDNFIRANSNTVNVAGKSWIEGQDSEELPGRTAADDFEIDTNKLQLDSAVGTQAALDWGARAPSVFHGYRIELDLSNLNLGATNDSVEFRFFMGLPDLYVEGDGITIGRERMYAIDASVTWSNTYPGNVGGQDICWQGQSCRVKIHRDSAGDYVVSTGSGAFLSSEKQSSRERRNGKLDTVIERVSPGLSSSSIQTNWVLEFGRRQLSSSVWKEEARLWKENTIDDIVNGIARDFGDGGDQPFQQIVTGQRGLDKQVGTFYRSLSKDGSGGFFGALVSFNKATLGTVEIPKINATTSLV